MTASGLTFYKIKTIKKVLTIVEQTRKQLFDELVTNATDPVIVRRRLRMLKHLNQYESQLIEKIHAFDTDDINDLINLKPKGIGRIVNRSA